MRVPTVFLLQNKRLKRTTSNTDLLPLTPISSSLALRSIILFHFYCFALCPFCPCVLFIALSASQCPTLRALLSPATLLNKRCVNRCFFSIFFFVFYEFYLLSSQVVNFLQFLFHYLGGYTLICF